MTMTLEAGAQPLLPAARQARSAFVAEALEGARISANLRLVCVPILMAFIAFFMRGNQAMWFVELCLVVYATVGGLELAMIRHFARTGFRRRGAFHVVIVGEMALIAFAIFGSQAFFDQPWPMQTIVHSRPVIYFFFVMALYALNFSPWLMLWATFMAALSWSAGMTWLVTLPDSITSVPPGLTAAQAQALVHDPHFVDINVWIQDVLVILLTGFVLATVVWRSQSLVRREIATARERANLARHFPPTMVDEIAHHDGLLDQVRRQRVAVMFVDVVGFTRLAESLDAEATVAVLRGLHRRLETAVFEHGGTLDKFLGDGVMATFGTPRSSGRDSANALEAARAALAAADKWNAKRAARGAQPIRLAIGLHVGEVVLGDVGSERRLEYAVIGDTVNVAARLEQLARELDARILASDDLVAAARTEGADTGALEPSGEHTLRGREAPVALWRLPL